MRKLLWIALLLGNLTGTSYAGADDGATATLSWRLGFGAGEVQPGYALAFGYRGAERGAVSANLFALEVTDLGAFARVAGLPLHGNGLRAELDDGVAGAAEMQPARPWFARPWVLWTAGGLAATLAVAGGDGEVELCHNCNNSNSGQTASTNVGSVNGNGEVCGTQGVPGAPDTCAEAGGCVPGGAACVNCNDSGVTQGCEGEGWTARRHAGAATDLRDIEPGWLAAGTGGMGDLIPR